ncbi:hypothetical protein A1D29_01115 [Pasteurellaceae bacterium Orientalotternb1]|nr:hypothetical protein A1D29_01115 [Pasteurellaceae bacterium Orientalotternb1]
MNKIFKVIWHHATQSWVVTSELSKAHGKTASTVSAASAAESGLQINGIYKAGFVYTAIASAILMASGQAFATNPPTGSNGYTQGSDNYCYYDNESESVICGDATTTTAIRYDTKTAKSVVVGKGATNTGESNVAVGVSSASKGTASIAIGSEAKANFDQTVAIGQNAEGNGRWDISIGRFAGQGATAPKPTASNTNSAPKPEEAEGRNIAIGDGALKNGLDVNNNIAMGTGAGQSMKGARNVVLGTYANTTEAISTAKSNGSTEQEINLKKRQINGAGAEVDYIDVENTVAIGHRALSTKIAAVAVGQQAKAFGTTSTAVGNGTRALGDNSVAMGNTANAGAGGAIAIGLHANYDPNQTAAANKYKQTGGNSIAIGYRPHASHNHAIAMGTESKALNNGAVAIGSESKTEGLNATAIGQVAHAKGQNSFAGGNDSHAIGKSAVAIGDGAGKGAMTTEEYKAGNYANAASGESSTAVGPYTKAAGVGAVAVGYSANGKSERSVAVGPEASVTSNKGIAVGYKASAHGEETSNIAIGQESYTNASGAIALGQKASAKGLDGVVTTGKDKALPYNAIAIGTNANVDTKAAENGAKQERSTDAIAIGTNAAANYASTIAIGYDAKANKKSSATAIGLQSNAEGWKSLAIGVKATATQTDSVALGSDSLADVGFNKTGVDPLSAKDAGSQESAVWRSTKAAVSVGNIAQGVTRQITSVAAGTEDTDAVNVAQLKAAGFVLDTAADVNGGTAINSTPADATGTADNKIANGESLTLKAGKGVTLNQNGSEVTIKTAYYSVNTTDTTDESNFNNDGAKAIDSVAAGVRVKTTQKNSVAVGSDALADGAESLALGNKVKAIGLGATAVGNNSKAEAQGAQAFGQSSEATAQNAAAIGRYARATAERASAFGVGNIASGTSSFSGGDKSVASGEKSIAIGLEAKSTHSNTIAIGSEAVAKVNQGVALGAKSVADVAAGVVGSDPLLVATDKNNNTWTSTHSAVSVGNGTTVTRQITSVAAGTQDTDAVNVAQLKASGFKLAASHSEGESTTIADDKIQNGETVTVDAGKNIKVTHTANQVSIATKDDVEFTSVTTGNTVMNNEGITVKAPANQQGSNPTTDVKLTANGLNNGGNSITNVKGNLPETTNGDKNANPAVPATTSQIAPADVNAIKNNAATVGDILNSGFNLQTNASPLDFVKAYDTVNFQNGVNTKIRANTYDNVSSIFVDVVGLPVKYTTPDGRPVAKVGDQYYLLDANGQPCQVCNKPQELIASVINPIAKPNETGKATTLANVQGNLQQVKADGQVNNPNGTKVKDPSTDNLKTGPQTAADIATLRDTPKTANNAATLGDVLNAGWNLQGNGKAVDFVRHADTVNFVDGTGTTVEVTSEDGITSKVKVNTLVELVDAEGNPVKKAADGKFYKASDIGADGNPTAGAAEVAKPQVNLVNPTAAADQQTKSLIQLGNVDKGTKDTDGVNVSQLKGATDALGLTIDPNTGEVSAPNFVVTKTDGSKFPGATTIQGALDNIGTELQKPLTFGGDTGADVTRKLGQKVNLVGGITEEAKLSDNNIGVVADGTDKLTIKLAKDIKVDSVVAGGTKIDNNGLTFVDDVGTPVPNTPSISKTGINAGNQKVTNLAKGTDDTDAVNVAQLKEVDAKAGVKTKVTAGDGVDVTNKGTAEAPNYEVALNQATKDSLAKADSAVQGIVIKAEGNQVKELTKDNNELNIKGDDTNISVTNDNGDVKVALNKDVTGLDSLASKKVTAGEGENQVVLDNKGVNVGGNTYISNAGLNANDKAITNVKSNLPVTEDNTKTQSKPNDVDAIKNNAATVADVLNAGFNLQTNGTATDFVKPYDTVNFADGTGTTVTSETNGTTTTFKVNVDAQKLAETAQLPVVYTKEDGTKVYKHSDGKFYTDPTDKANEVQPANIIASMQGADGSTTNPTTLANVQAGKKDTDAVNVSQLKGAVDTLGGGAAVNPDGTIKAPTYNITNPADGTVKPVNNVGDALSSLNDAVNSPLTFGGDTGTDVTRKLGQKVSLIGGVNDPTKLSNANIGVVANGTDTLSIKLAKDLVGLSTAEFQDADGNVTNVGGNGIAIKPVDPTKETVSLTKDGLNNGGNVISNVANGAKTFVAPQVDGQNIKQANDGKWYPADQVEPNGTLKAGAAAIDPAKVKDALAQAPNGGLVDFANSNPNNAATVGDLQNLGFNIGTSENGYTDQVRNNAKVDFVGDKKFINVEGSTNKDTGAREIKISLKEGDVIKPNEGIATIDGKPTEVVKTPDGNYYKKADIDPTTGEPKAGAQPLTQAQKDTVVNNGDGLVTGHKVAEALQKSGWTVGKADAAEAAKVDYNNKSEKVNPDDNVSFADGKNTQVSLGTVKKVDNEGKVVTTTTVKVDVDLPIDFKYTDATGKEFVKANDGKFYAKDDVNADGSVKTPTDPAAQAPKALEPAEVAQLNKGAQLTNGLGSATPKYEVKDPVAAAAEKAVADTLAANPQATPAEILKAVDAAKAAAIQANPEAKDTVTKGTGGVNLDNVAWAERPDQAVNKDQLDQTVNKSGFFVQQNGQSTVAGKPTEKVTPNDVVNFTNGSNTVVSATTTRDAATGVDTTNVSVHVNGLPLTYTTKDPVTGKDVPVAKVGDKFYQVGADGKPDMAKPADVNSLSTNLVNPAAPNGDIGAPSQLGNLANGANTFVAPQVDGKDIKLANDGKWYAADQVDPNGTAKAGATAVDAAKAKDALGKAGNGGLVDFAKSNPNNAATVGDLQNLGFVVGTADDKYQDQVRNNSRVEFASGNKNATVTGSTLADGTRQVKVTISDNPVFNKVQTNTVQVGGAAGPVISATASGDLKVAKPDGSAARITNVAPGVNGTDAVNVNQLKQGLGDINNRITKTDKNLRGGIAGSNAAAGLPQVYQPGKSMVAAAAGTYKGESAVAVGYSRSSDNGKVILKLQGNANTRGDFGGSVGVGYQW